MYKNIVFFCLIFFAPMVWSIVSFIKWLKWKKIRNKYSNKSISDFWLNYPDKLRFASLLRNFFIINDKIHEIESHFDDLWATVEAENISLNIDGSISRRSNRGKELNQLLDENEREFNLYRRERADLEYKLDFLSKKPISEWNRLKKVFAPYFASTYALGSWFASFYLLLFYFFKKPFFALIEINDYYKLGRENFFILKDNWITSIFLTILISTIVSICFYYLRKYVVENFMFEKRFPKPPLVTNDNYDQY